MKKTLLLFISLCLVCISSFAADRLWNFTGWSTETLENLEADANYTKGGTDPYFTYTYKNKISTAAELKANSVVIKELKGLQLSTSNTNRFMIDTRSGGSFRLSNTGAYLHVLDCKAGDIITIVTKTASAGNPRGFTNVVNATIMNGYSMTSAEELTGKYEVTTNGQVRFDPSGGIQVYSIHVQEYVASEPIIKLKSGTANQTVYPTQAIKNNVYEWGGNATSASIEWTGTASATTAPDGISVNVDDEGKTVTISGAPTSATAATYGYSVTSTDGSQTTTPLTGTIEVKVTDKYKLAYITTVTGGVADSRDQILFTGISEKFDINVIDATETGVDYSVYDVVALSAVPNSSSAGIMANQPSQAAALNKPFVQMKTFLVNSSSGRWNWVTTAANTKDIREIELTSAGLNHKLFNGTTISGGNTIQLIDDAYDFTVSANNGIVTFDTWNSHITPAPVTLAKPLGSELGSYAEIAVGTQIGANAEDITQYPVLLLGLSEASWNNLTADAKTIFANALKYVVNDDFGVGIANNVTDNSNKTVVAKEYYDLMGKKLGSKEAAPVNSIVIERSVYEDGSVEYQKVRYAK